MSKTVKGALWGGLVTILLLAWYGSRKSSTSANQNLSLGGFSSGGGSFGGGGAGGNF